MNLLSLSFLLPALNIGVFVFAALVFALVTVSRPLPSARWLTLLLAAFCWMSFCTLNVYAQDNQEIESLFLRLRFIGLALLAPTWIFFISTNYARWLWLRKPIAKFILFAPSSITILFAIVPSLQHFLIKDFAPLHVENLTLLQYKVGAWFPFHFGWSVFLVIVSLIFFADVARKGSRDERLQVLLLATGTVITVAIDTYYAVWRPELRGLMVSSGTYVIHEFTLAYAAFRHRLLDPSPLAMEKVYLDFPDPVVIIDSQGRLRSHNKAAGTLFDLNIDALGKNIEVVIPQLFSVKNELNLSFNGYNRFFEVQVEPIQQKGQKSGDIIYLREVTSLKKNKLDLEQRLDFKAHLMSLIAHDLSNHVNDQARLSDEIQKIVPTDFRKTAEVLAESIFSSRELMDNLLTWSKTQEASFQLSIRPFELKTLIEDVTEDISTTASLKSISIELKSLPPAPVIMRGDSEMLASVFRNILTNAIRASKPEEKIEITIEVGPTKVIVGIQDYGSGMSEKKVQEILSAPSAQKPFLMSANSDNFGQDNHGYGIGLKMALRFIQLHNGQIEIQSRLNIGTLVQIHLPL